MADGARALCWQHIDLYRAARPRLTVRQIRYMLEPATNLARLHLRSNNPRSALLILEAMHNAVTTGTHMLIDGRVLPMADLSGTPGQRNRLRGVALALADHGQLPALPVPARWDSILLLS